MHTKFSREIGGKKPIRKHRHRSENNYRTYLKEKVYEFVGWILLAQDKDQ